MYRLYNGDCLQILGEIEKENSNKNLIIVSDPPFNIGYKYKTYKDRMKDEDYYGMMGQVFGSLPSVIVHYPEALFRIAKQIGKIPERVVSWVYNSNTARQHRDIAFFDVNPDFRKMTQPYKNQSDKRIRERIARGILGGRLYDWWEINQVKNVSKGNKGIDHPCVMPVEVMERVVGILPDDAVIIDPFMGSGTTGVACINMGRDFIGIEIDSGYFSTARRLIEEAKNRKEMKE